MTIIPSITQSSNTSIIFERSDYYLNTLDDSTKVARARPIKVKSTTKPTPTLVSNTYECLANDNNDDEDDDDCTDRTVEIKEEQ